jgi:hypothetical protein
MAFLVTKFGRPFSPKGFSNKFREWCDEADLLLFVPAQNGTESLPLSGDSLSE